MNIQIMFVMQKLMLLIKHSSFTPLLYSYRVFNLLNLLSYPLDKTGLKVSPLGKVLTNSWITKAFMSPYPHHGTYPSPPCQAPHSIPILKLLFVVVDFLPNLIRDAYN